LLKRVLLLDVLACPCGGRRRVVAFITEQKVIKAILERLDLPTTGPPIELARTAVEDVDGWQDDVPKLQQAPRRSAPGWSAPMPCFQRARPSCAW
jgi:hypothetical protein